MKLILFLAILVILSVMSCEQECIKADLRFGLIGFSDSEADTILVKRFTKTESTIAKDSFLLDGIRFQRNNDSLKMVALPGTALLQSDYNYEIFFPESGKRITVSDIIEDKETMTKGLFDCTKNACVNSITSCTINGQFTNIAGNNLIYLKK